MPRQSLLCRFALILFILSIAGATAGVAQPSRSVTAALLSDTHLDPFRDPGKAKELALAPVEQWQAIFAAPSSPNAAQAYAELQATCHEKLDDADNSLVLSAFDAAAGAKPQFVLVGGDMLVHAFQCRYRTLLDPSGTDTAGAAAFAAKTVQYQLEQLHIRFPKVPVHIALGNNDTDCEDYAIDAESAFLHALAPAVQTGWAGVTGKERDQAAQAFLRFGSYAVALPGTRNAKLIVLDDLYLSSDYKGTCRRGTNSASSGAMLAWLSTQLADSRKHGQAVWVLGHMPPEVNVYRTYLHPHDICNGQAPEMFFRNPALNDLLVSYHDVVRVFISGHTHIDEIHRIDSATDKSGTVAMKTIPSVTPISTNPPAFLLASLDPVTAVMTDYTMQTASAVSGDKIRWNTLYDFRSAYKEPAYTAATLTDMMQRWSVSAEESQPQIDSYQTHLANGLRLLALRASWPQQLCAMQHSSAKMFSTCACAAKGGLLPPLQEAK